MSVTSTEGELGHKFLVSLARDSPITSLYLEDRYVRPLLTHVVRDCAAYPVLPFTWLKGLWLPQLPSFPNIEYRGSQRRVTESYKTLVKQLLQLNFNPSNPIGIAQYDAVDSMVVLDNNSMMGSILRLGGTPERSLERTWTKFLRSGYPKLDACPLGTGPTASEEPSTVLINHPSQPTSWDDGNG